MDMELVESVTKECLQKCVDIYKLSGGRNYDFGFDLVSNSNKCSFYITNTLCSDEYEISIYYFSEYYDENMEILKGMVTVVPSNYKPTLEIYSYDKNRLSEYDIQRLSSLIESIDNGGK